MEREKQIIEEMAKEMLEISTSANVEPVLEIDGKEIILGESATRVLDNILEQAFIPYLAEKLYNAGYRKVEQGEWISVEDRLPSESIKCLVYTKRGSIFKTLYHHTDTQTFGFEFWDVTHWMPLPQPPKMKEGE